MFSTMHSHTTPSVIIYNALPLTVSPVAIDSILLSIQVIYTVSGMPSLVYTPLVLPTCAHLPIAILRNNIIVPPIKVASYTLG